MKKFILMVILVLALSLPLIATAEPVNTFDGQSALFGLNAGQYICEYDGCRLIYCTGQDAYTYTSTNIRAMPDASSDKKSTKESGTRVKIWGYTDNGWCLVYYISDDGQACSGYIRSDLLDLQTPQNEEQPI